MSIDKWDKRFLDLAAHIGQWSRDRTKVGCVIVDPERRVVACGFNGFARGCDDSPELYADRERKIRRVVHAEPNALLFACRSVKGATCYTTPFPSCSQCAALLIQAGIVRVVGPVAPPDLAERWAADLTEATLMFQEAGVEQVIVGGGQ